MSGLLKTAKDITYALYPSRCRACGEIVPAGEHLCDYCYEMLERTGRKPLCPVCGCEKIECQCKHRVFFFGGYTAPFFNDGIAKKVMYSFKFGRKGQGADFFAEQMALCVRERFTDFTPDCVAYVPMTFFRELRRGYNQSRELAVRIAGILGIPLAERALLACGHKVQRKLSKKQRFENVKGRYRAGASLRNSRVLLVDDIKTTGATLNECSRILLAAGVAEVYCVTGLITQNKKKQRRI